MVAEAISEQAQKILETEQLLPFREHHFWSAYNSARDDLG